jgi:LmbE family N-acetylglucosaminyl deacetylase
LPFLPEEIHHVAMNRPRLTQPAFSSRRAWRAVLALLVAALLLLPALAQSTGEAPSPVDPLPQDTGAAGLKQTLRRLQTTARLLQIDAHPDDEDGGMLTLESRGKGVSVTLLTLNRGEGGQNKVGSNLFDVLGVLRTLEVTAAGRYYGVDQRFTRVADFGYSKNPEETFQKWGGHDIALADIVRTIRQVRPDVLVARFSGTERDGHGHHQASAILTKEAFRAAADPNRFPEQIKDGLLPWQAKKLYIGNVCQFFAQTCPDKDYTIKLNTGEEDPLLGTSYIQFALEGLRHQLSQGLGGVSAPSGPRYTFYRLVDSVLPPTADKEGHEKDFLDGIDTSLPGLAARLGEEEKKVPWLRPELAEIAGNTRKAGADSEGDPSRAVGPLSAAVKTLSLLVGSIVGKIDHSNLSRAAKADLRGRLLEKFDQAETGLNLALNVTLEATVLALQGSKPGLPREADALTVISPGQKFAVRVTFHNGSKYPLQAGTISLVGVNHWNTEQKGGCSPIQPGQDRVILFAPQLPANFPSTRPYWHRDNPEEDSVNTVDDARYAGFPFPPPAFVATAGYTIAEGAGASTPCASALNGVHSQIASDVVVPFVDDKGEQQKRVLAVAPEFSVMLEPVEQVIPVENGAATSVKVAVSCNLAGAPIGKLHLEAPPGWRVDPAELAVKLDRRGAMQDYQFKVIPASLQEGRAQIRAVLDAGETKYSEGYSLVTREDLNSFYYYQPALQRVSMVDVKVPKGLRVGYIMGAGDDIPTVLQQIGMDVRQIPAEKIASADLSGFGTIVLGIRAYDTQKDVAANNKKLLDYVSSGGTLVVQYNAGVGDFNNGHFAPYPAQLSRARVSVEEAPVEILAPEDSALHYPNQITQRDFDGWVQERGLYFMDQWDDHFMPLLACNDPGEQPQKGGLLRAPYGKGTYIYTGYAFFRQLPAGVPGAIRLYVNLLSAGHEGSR